MKRIMLNALAAFSLLTVVPHVEAKSAINTIYDATKPIIIGSALTIAGLISYYMYKYFYPNKIACVKKSPVEAGAILDGFIGIQEEINPLLIHLNSLEDLNYLDMQHLNKIKIAQKIGTQQKYVQLQGRITHAHEFANNHLENLKLVYQTACNKIGADNQELKQMRQNMTALTADIKCLTAWDALLKQDFFVTYFSANQQNAEPSAPDYKYQPVIGQ